MTKLPTRAASTWAERVRVVEKKTFRGRIYGYQIEIRFSGDDEPERWDSASQAAIFGPPALVSALDEARDEFKSLGGAEAAAIKLAAAFDRAERA